MARRLTFNLPEVPPSANGLFANRKGGRYKTAAYKRWIDLCQYVVQAQHDGEIITAPLRATYTFMRPSKRRMDVANREKGTSDLLERAGVIKDDSQIVDLRLKWATEPMESPVKIVLEIIEPEG